jgi:hypothetical protein
MNSIASGQSGRDLASRGFGFSRDSGRSGKNGVSPRLLAAVAAQETGGPGSNSGRNIIGDGGHGHGNPMARRRTFELRRFGAASLRVAWR